MSRRNFRILIVISWLLLIIGIILAVIATERFLPPELKAYLDAQANAPITTSDLFALVFGLVYIIFYFVVSIGLFFFKRWAKALFLPSIVIGSVFLLFSGPYIETGAESFIAYIYDLIEGIILALIYFSPTSRMFE